MIPPRSHAILDAASAVGLVLLPPLLTRTRPFMRRRLAAAGAAVAGYSLMTRYDGNQSRPLSMSSHRAIDMAQGAAFCVAAAQVDNPRLRRGMVAYGLFSLAAAALTDDEPRRTTAMFRD